MARLLKKQKLLKKQPFIVAGKDYKTGREYTKVYDKKKKKFVNFTKISGQKKLL